MDRYQINADIPESLRKRYWAYAKKKGMKKSAILITALEEYLDRAGA